MKRAVFLIINVSFHLLSCAQSSSTNYIASSHMLDATGRTQTSVQFFDGLGRPVQTATNSLGGSGKTVYLHQSYNSVGEISDTFFPVSSGTSFFPLSGAELQSLSQSQYGDIYTYTHKDYDALGRESETFGPGRQWHDNGKKRHVEYGTNASLSVKLYTAPSGDKYSLVQTGYYNAGTLYSEKTTDEDGHTVEEFKDKNGDVVLIRRDGNNDTYYVYNSSRQLRFVLSPDYQNHGYKSKYAYEYRYDDHGRMVKKILPGCEPIQYWYDIGDRMSFMQDAILREHAEYRFYLYDRYGRQTLQGICGREAKDLRRDTLSQSRYSSGISGICSSGYTTGNDAAYQSSELEQASYYDSYDFLENPEIKKISAAHDFTACNPSFSKGQLTGTLTRTTDGELLLKVYRYDSLGRLVHTTETYPDHVFADIEMEYTYTDQLSKTTETLTTSSGTCSVTTERSYNKYNDRPETTAVTIDGNRTVLSRNEYSDIGMLVGYRQNNGTVNTAYTYNIRGWTTSVSNKYFTEHLYYADGIGEACYNGNVSSMKWTAPDNSQPRGYKFRYDGLDRLLEATYGERDDLSNHANRYNEKVLSYSANGMIRRFQRRGLKDDGEYGKTDNLNIELDGNRLVKVTDDALPVNKYQSSDFRDGASESTEYAYNGNGALTSDLNRGITNIQYDVRCNPVRILFQDSLDIQYTYDASGRKLKSRHSFGNFPIAQLADARLSALNATHRMYREKSYCGNFILSDGKIDKYLYDGGYVSFTSDGPHYYYYIKDHLGSNRAVVDEKGEILQLVHYYPFGGIFVDAGISREAQKYLFCGKEREPVHGMNTYDFGSRQYFTDLPLWDRMDPLCEKSPELSPYVYCNDNPINRLDKNGKDSYLIVWASQNDTYGHASIGVDNYKYNVLTNKMEKDGTISTFGLFPYGNYNGKDAILDKKVKGLFFVDSKTKIDDVINNNFNSNERYKPDGILKFSDSYDEDETIRRNIKSEMDSNKGYRGRTRNCSTFVKDVLPDRLKKNIDGNESFLFMDYITPNKLFTDAKEKNDTEVILDPDDKVKSKFKNRIIIK